MTDDLMSLDDILNDEVPKQPETVAEEPEVTGEPEKAEEPKQDDPPDPDKAPEETSEKDSTPESQKTPEDESWTKAAVLDERRKRQELERQLEELKGKQEEPKRPDVFEDPDGAFSHLEQQFNQKILNERITLSRALMEDRHEDYAEKETVFVEMAKDNPDLIRQMQASPFPAKFAYEQASKSLEFKAMQDVDSYKNKIREEVKAEILKEMEAKNSKQAEKDKIIETPSLAKTRSAKDEPITDKTLEEIVPIGVG